MLNNAVAVFAAPVPPVTNSYESIATVTVGAGGSAYVEFTSIPSTFKHLQIRLIGQSNRSTYGSDALRMLINSNTSAVYSNHCLRGDGSSASAVAYSSQTDIPEMASQGLGTTTSGFFGAAVIDFLDYANTNKNKTIRCLSGTDNNGTISGVGGIVSLNSASFQSTSAISTVKLYPYTGTLFSQYSSFALYGIKG